MIGQFLDTAYGVVDLWGSLIFFGWVFYLGGRAIKAIFG